MPYRNDETVMHSQDRRVCPYKIGNHIITDTAINIHEPQSSTTADEVANSWVVFFDGIKQF